ncbi:MAG: hypothetical protein AAF349_07635 [Cyanobacteria bacterium P01_A01_bin.68]
MNAIGIVLNRGKSSEAVTSRHATAETYSVGRTIILPKWQAYASNRLWQNYASNFLNSF